VTPVPTRLRPTAPIAADAILVGDPGRALLLGQELLSEPKMSNHARGLWGYSGRTPDGNPLTVQSTGMGGPSAALVLGELAELGLQRTVRVGTCVAFDRSLALGELLLVAEAVAGGGSATSFGVAVDQGVDPDRELTEGLVALGKGLSRARIASFDAHPREHEPGASVVAGDMQTAPLLARAHTLGVRAAALLIVSETTGGEVIAKDDLEEVERRAGRFAAQVLSS
jgi:purine-nucleoside phosphorylase